MARRPIDPDKPNRYAEMSVDPMFKTVWERALVSPVTIVLPTRTDMNRMRYKLYEARKVMQAHNDPLYNSIKNLTIHTRAAPEGKLQLVIDASDVRLRKLLYEQLLSIDPNSEEEPPASNFPDSDIFNPED